MIKKYSFNKMIIISEIINIEFEEKRYVILCN